MRKSLRCEQMINLDIMNVLRRIVSRLESLNENWAVVGSLGLALRGIPVDPRDIDLMTDKKAAYEIEAAFSEFMTQKVSPRTSEVIQSHFGALEIDGVKVEIMGEFRLRRPDGGWEDPPDLRSIRRFVRVGDMQVPVLSLEWEYHAYSMLGRMDRARAIRELMKAEPFATRRAAPQR